MVISQNASSSMVAVSHPPLPLNRMEPSSSHAYRNGPHDASTLHRSQCSRSQRSLSHIMPPHAPSPPSSSPPSSSSHHDDARPSQPGISPTTSTALHAPPLPPSMHLTPHKSSMRLSHPPPAPSSSFLQQITPQSKRIRFSYNNHDTDSATNTATSPLSQSSSTLHHTSTRTADTASLSSPSLSNVRPLSGISRPLPVPPTPSRPQRPSPSVANASPLIPMPQRSIQDFEKLLPQRQSAVARYPRTHTPQRALLQHIPPQPSLPLPMHHVPAAPPPAPAIESLSSRQGWSLTGFRSFDLDLDRIAQVVQLEQIRAHSLAESGEASHQTRIQPAADGVSHPDVPRFGLPDRGLPAGSILEVLGPPGSGKSSLTLQFAVTERLRALRRARASLMVPELVAETDENETSALPDSSYFSEEFWDAEIACADQALMIDCEGALTPEKVADAAWAAVIALWTSLQDESQDATRPDREKPSPHHQRSAMPEEVRRLVAAVLAGLHVSRVTSLAGLVALLHSMRPTDELQEGLNKSPMPSTLPPRTSLILIDSLSYYVRPSGGSSQDRKLAAQVGERVRDMLFRLQKPFEYRPLTEHAAEEQEAARQRCTDAAAKLCIPTIVFTNQLGIRRGRNESDASGRASPVGRSPMGASSSRTSNSVNARSEGASSLAPLLNGTRTPQPARLRDERPAPSVALSGPDMWDDEDQPATATISRHRQQLSSRNATQPMGHDRGWPPSFLGQDVWRMLLFRHGAFGQRYAQMVSVPPAVQTELSELWTQTRERATARVRTGSVAAAQASEEAGGAGQAPLQEAAEAKEDNHSQSDAELSSSAARQAEVEQDKQMLELLSQLRASLFRWRPFHIDSYGLVS